MSTWKLITVLAKATGLQERDIGYAGLKDKNATTIQYISLPKKYEKELNKNLTTEKIEILDIATGFNILKSSLSWTQAKIRS